MLAFWTHIFLTIKRSDVVLFFCWVLSLCLVSPFGNFPINDDWAYARNVHSLVVEHVFYVDPFPAMNLISQTLFGAAVTTCFGFSFVVLRMSIFLLTVLSSFVFKKQIQSLTAGDDTQALLVCLVFFFNPMSLLLSMTFMTDMFFLAMIIFGFNFLMRYLQQRRTWQYLAFVFFMLMAALNRQHGLLFSWLSLGMYRGAKSGARDWFFIILAPSLCWLAQHQYQQFLSDRHIAHGIKTLQHFTQFLKETPWEVFLIRLANTTIVTGLIGLPLMVYRLPMLLKVFRAFFPAFLLALLPSCYLCYVVWDTYPIGNIMGILESGPRVLRVEWAETYNPLEQFFRKSQMVLGTLGFAMFVGMFVARRTTLRMEQAVLAKLFLGIAVMLLVLVLGADAYFDRYNLPMILILLWLFAAPTASRINYPATLGSYLFALLLMGFAVIETRDYFRWQDNKWQVLEALEQAGVSKKDLDGGFEFHGWYKPNPDWSPGGKSWWWVLNDDYLVSSQRLPHCRVLLYEVPSRWLEPGKDSIFVLQRIPASGTSATTH